VAHTEKNKVQTSSKSKMSCTQRKESETRKLGGKAQFPGKVMASVGALRVGYRKKKGGVTPTSKQAGYDSSSSITKKGS